MQRGLALALWEDRESIRGIGGQTTLCEPGEGQGSLNEMLIQAT